MGSIKDNSSKNFPNFCVDLTTGTLCIVKKYLLFLTVLIIGLFANSIFAQFKDEGKLNTWTTQLV
jgi:hypothetical protein